jgi:hypothetical protein
VTERSGKLVGAAHVDDRDVFAPVEPPLQVASFDPAKRAFAKTKKSDRNPMAKKPTLKPLGSSLDPTAPPASLGKAGAKLWSSIMAEYEVSDAGGLALLSLACEAVDGIAEDAATIARDGRLVRGKFGVREHPLLRHQLAQRAFVCRTLQRLGLNLEGRPADQNSDRSCLP